MTIFGGDSDSRTGNTVLGDISHLLVLQMFLPTWKNSCEIYATGRGNYV